MGANNETARDTGLTRREMLQRGAALGAALAVATPAVQGLGRMAAFAQVTPEPTPSPSPSPEPTLRPSHFQILVSFGGFTEIGLKFDEEGWDRIPPAPSCFGETEGWHPDDQQQDIDYWNPKSISYDTEQSVLEAFKAGNFVITTDESFTLTGLPEGIAYQDGKAFDGSFGGDRCGPTVEFDEDDGAVFTK